MDLKILKKSEYVRWDKFVKISPQGRIFCYSWWLNTTTNGDFEILVILNDNEIIAGMPIPFYNTKRIRMPKLTQTLGVLFKDLSNLKISKRLEKEHKINELFAKYLRNNKFKFNINFNYNFDSWLGFYWNNFYQTTRYTYTIEYTKNTIKDIWNNMNQKHRNILRKFEKNKNLIIKETENIEEFYKINKLTFRRQNIKIPYTFEYVQKLDKILKEKNARKIFKAIDTKGDTIAASYFIHDEKSAYYLMSGANPESRNTGAQLATLWEGIKYFYGKTKIFDFEGSMIKGVEQNFRKFSAEPKEYYHIYTENTLTLIKKIILKILR